MYIYIYIYREREREREYQQVQKQVNIHKNQLKLDLEKLGVLQYQLPDRDNTSYLHNTRGRKAHRCTFKPSQSSRACSKSEQ